MIYPADLQLLKLRNRARTAREFLAFAGLLILLLAVTAALCVAVFRIQDLQREKLAMQQPLTCDKAADGVTVCADFRRLLAANGTTFPRGEK